MGLVSLRNKKIRVIPLKSKYVPKKGDIIFFAFNSSASNHVGLVDYVADGHVHTIEGNSDDAVRQRTYSLSYGSILGYGSPNYQ